MFDLLLASTILVIGDSHTVGPFGWYLDESLRNNGHQVATYASCGSIGKWWATGQSTTCGFYSNDLNNVVTKATKHPTPILTDLLNDIKPDVVIVELGSNYVKTPGDEFVKSDLKTLVKKIKDARAEYFWITPPDMRLYRNQIPRLDQLIQSSIGEECTLFDSKKVATYPTSGGDGVHYWFPAGMPVARKWADSVAEGFKP